MEIEVLARALPMFVGIVLAAVSGASASAIEDSGVDPDLEEPGHGRDRTEIGGVHMREGSRIQASQLAVGVLVLGGLLGCGETDLAYLDQPPWEAAAPGALGFRGYSDPEGKITACGNCHPGSQAQWAGTAHAGAWETLQASGHAEASCEPCHSVSDRGNATTDPNVGFAASSDPRFVDVQCENCHGPAVQHLANPAGPKPLPAFEAARSSGNGCGECHQGAHQPFVEEWSLSAHGLGPNTEYAGEQGDSCAQCHEGQRALALKFGVEATYLETGDGKLRTITCVVCHAAHGSPYDAQLRASIDVPTRDNLCMRCHARSGTPWSSHGPHAAQGLLLLDEDVGYRPPGFSFPDARERNNHGPDNNPRLCVTCHVARRTITDENGNFLLESVGHTFQAASCTDSEGRPVVGKGCSPEARTFAACVGSGCHGGEWSARDAYVRARNRLNVLLDELWADIDGDHVLEATDHGLLPQVIALGFAADLDPDDSTMNPAKGAMWNAMLAWTDDRTQWSDGEVGGVHFSSHPNSGNGAHNPHLLEALLLASIRDVRESYGAAPSPAFDATPQLTGNQFPNPNQD